MTTSHLTDALFGPGPIPSLYHRRDGIIVTTHGNLVSEWRVDDHLALSLVITDGIIHSLTAHLPTIRITAWVREGYYHSHLQPADHLPLPLPVIRFFHQLTTWEELDTVGRTLASTA